MTADEILAELTKRAWRFGVAVLVSPNATVNNDGMKCGGYFTDGGDQPSLAVAWGRDDQQRLGLLLHEYSHMTQWAEGAPIWDADQKTSAWGDWLKGKPLKNAKAIIATSRDLEADCERRAIRLAKELEAPIDLEKYARSANAYVHFYNVMAEKRCWYKDGRGPYQHPEVLALCNPTLDKDFSKTPKALFDAIAARLA